MDNDELLKELRTTFLEELEEVLEELESSFLRFERDPNDNNSISELFRYFHNIKGSSKAIGFDSLATFTHSAETVLSKLRSAELIADESIVSAILKTIDLMGVFFEEARVGNFECSEIFASHKSVLDKIIDNEEKPSTNNGLQLFDEDPPKAATPEPKAATPEAAKNAAPKSVKESQSNENKSEQNIGSAAIKSQADQGKLLTEETIKIPIRRINDLLDLFGEQVILQSSLDHILEKNLEDERDFIRKTVVSLKKITQDLQHTMVSMRMVSIKPLFVRMERSVRDVCKITGKDIDFLRIGETQEIDKTIVDALMDPLNHMVRNSIDHGIETPDIRKQLGKNPKGTVILSAQRNGGAFEIILEDDGKGLDKDKILQKAISQGLVRGDGSDLNESQIYEFIFNAGFSTKDEVTEISGRGVGLDVVKQKIKMLKGTFHVSSTLNKGSKFTIKLPLSLAMFNGTVVNIDNERYVVPNSDFNEAIYFDRELINKGLSKENVIRIKDRVLKLIDLRKILYTPKRPMPSKDTTELIEKKHALALISTHDQEEYAFIVNDIISQEQIVLKRLGPEFRQVKMSSGGTILGDGQVAIVLDLNTMLESKNLK